MFNKVSTFFWDNYSKWVPLRLIFLTHNLFTEGECLNPDNSNVTYISLITQMSNIFLLLRSQALHFNIHSKNTPIQNSFLIHLKKSFNRKLNTKKYKEMKASSLLVQSILHIILMLIDHCAALTSSNSSISHELFL